MGIARYLINRINQWGGGSRDVVANVLDCDIVVSEFEHQSRYYFHFRTNAPWKTYEPLIPPQLSVK